MNAAAAALVVLNGRQAFDPRASLFAHNEPGFWYDPSDLSLMYQDSAGTTPVTAVEQAVGLILDKSKGLVLGSELVTNGGPSFVNTTGWSTTGSATVSIVGGNLRITRGATAGAQTATIQYTGAVIGGGYFMTVAMAANSANINTTVQSYGNTTLANSATVGGSPTRTIFYNADRTNPFLIFRLETGSSGDYVDISLASVKAIAGNHAIQPTSASRPTLRARYNLLTYSEQFDNAAWTKSNVTIAQNADVAPDGTTTADKLIENSATSTHQVYQNYQAPQTGGLVFSVYAKAVERSVIGLLEPNGNERTFNLSTGVATGSGATMTDVGNGWWRCVSTGAAIDTANRSYAIRLSNGSSTNYAGDGTSGALIWGAQLLTTNDSTALANRYQRIAAATDYDTVGFPPYLAFDGSDDSLYTGGSIDFSATDRMTVWAGVTKLSDAALGAVAEISADSTVNNGAFWLLAPYTAGVNHYSSLSRGTANAIAVSAAAADAAPDTAVLSARMDISAPVNELRVDSVIAQTQTATQGTGNYGSYPLYIGRRNNASLPFNGRVYALLGRGAATSAALISQAERWVAAKQGRTLA